MEVISCHYSLIEVLFIYVIIRSHSKSQNGSNADYSCEQQEDKYFSNAISETIDLIFLMQRTLNSTQSVN